MWLLVTFRALYMVIKFSKADCNLFYVTVVYNNLFIFILFRYYIIFVGTIEIFMISYI